MVGVSRVDYTHDRNNEKTPSRRLFLTTKPSIVSVVTSYITSRRLRAIKNDGTSFRCLRARRENNKVKTSFPLSVLFRYVWIFIFRFARILVWAISYTDARCGTCGRSPGVFVFHSTVLACTCARSTRIRPFPSSGQRSPTTIVVLPFGLAPRTFRVVVLCVSARRTRWNAGQKKLRNATGTPNLPRIYRN